jgi:hypothetical protein
MGEEARASVIKSKIREVVGRRIPRGEPWHTLWQLQDELIEDLRTIDPAKAKAISQNIMGMRGKFGNTVMLYSLGEYVERRKATADFERAIREEKTEQLRLI